MTGTRVPANARPIDVEMGANHALIRGPVRVVAPALREALTPARWDHNLHGLTVPIEKVSDVIEAPHSIGWPVRVGGATWTRT